MIRLKVELFARSVASEKRGWARRRSLRIHRRRPTSLRDGFSGTFLPFFSFFPSFNRLTAAPATRRRAFAPLSPLRHRPVRKPPVRLCVNLFPRGKFGIAFTAWAQSTVLPRMKASFSTNDRAASLACARRLARFVCIVLALFLGGCGTDTWATKSPVDGSDYPGWAKAVSLPLSPLQHQSTY
jgi:hypothetical protein